MGMAGAGRGRAPPFLATGLDQHLALGCRASVAPSLDVEASVDVLNKSVSWTSPTLFISKYWSQLEAKVVLCDLIFLIYYCINELMLVLVLCSGWLKKSHILISPSILLPRYKTVARDQSSLTHKEPLYNRPEHFVSYNVFGNLNFFMLRTKRDCLRAVSLLWSCLLSVRFN